MSQLMQDWGGPQSFPEITLTGSQNGGWDIFQLMERAFNFKCLFQIIKNEWKDKFLQSDGDGRGACAQNYSFLDHNSSLDISMTPCEDDSVDRPCGPASASAIQGRILWVRPPGCHVPRGPRNPQHSPTPGRICCFPLGFCTRDADLMLVNVQDEVAVRLGCA